MLYRKILISYLRSYNILLKAHRDRLFSKIIISISRVILHYFHESFISHFTSAIFFLKISELVVLAVDSFCSDHVVTSLLNQIWVILPVLKSRPISCKTFDVNRPWLSNISVVKSFRIKVLNIDGFHFCHVFKKRLFIAFYAFLVRNINIIEDELLAEVVSKKKFANLRLWALISVSRVHF